MGLMRFRLTSPRQLSDDTLQQAYLSGIDRTPWPVRVRIEGQQLVLERDVSESGSLNLLWEVSGHGILNLTTATLAERPEPYCLPLEIARGTICQVRNQLAEWQAIGLTVPAEPDDKLRAAIRRFATAVVDQDKAEGSARAAEEAICMAVDAGQLLAQAYAEQALTVRRRGGAKLPSILACEIVGAPLPEPAAAVFCDAFNTAQVPMLWRQIEAAEGEFSWTAVDRQIEWCRAKGLKVCAGPLVQLNEVGLPDSSYLWEDDYDSLLGAISAFVRAAVERYRGKVDYWICAARVNTAEVLSLSEEEELRLAATAVHLVRTLDPTTATIVAIDQPWGEYMARRSIDYPPMHFADALIRAGLDLKGLMLEMNLGSYRGATLPRTMLDVSRQLDHWAMLGLPLLVSLSAPSSSEEDARAQPRPAAWRGTWSPQAQQAWISRLAPLVLAKPGVSGLFWGQLRDDLPHELPHAGLFDERGQAKAALRAFAAIRQAYVK